MSTAFGGEAASNTPSPARHVVQFRAAKRAMGTDSPYHQHLAVGQQRRRGVIACDVEVAGYNPTPASRVIQFRGVITVTISACYQDLAVGQQRRCVTRV